MHRWLFKSLLILHATGCATLGGSSEEPLTIADSSDVQISGIVFKDQTGKAPYSYNQQSFAAEWMFCQIEQAKTTIIVMHSDQQHFGPKEFCGDWLAQTFLSEDINVIAVNRPGFGDSSGTADFAGNQSMAAIKAGVAAAVGAGAPRPSGIWGYSSGATAASLVSRELQDIGFLILGGGIYDLDETMRETKDGYLKKAITALYSSGGDSALEERSIAYDVEGLPKIISLYHGKQDTAIPPRQATVFRDTLVSSEYTASLQIVDGVAHQIPITTHQKILKALTRTILDINN